MLVPQARKWRSGRPSLLDGLVVVWPLDDASGMRHAAYGGPDLHLADVNTVTTGDGPTGRVASFASASTEGLLLSPCPESLRFTGPFTIAAWINPTGAQATNSVVNRNSGAGNASYWLYWLNTGRVQCNVTADGTTTVQATTGVGSVPASAWALAFIGYDGANIHAAYNDQAPSSTAHTTGIFAGTGDLAIGKRPTAGTQLYDGLIGSICMWRGRWLAPADRTYLFGGGRRKLSEWLPPAWLA